MIKKFDQFISEMIKVPIKVGDTVLGGRFKNKKVVVKKIGKNDKGDITINGKPLLKFRIIKESNKVDDTIIQDCNDILLDVKDLGYIVKVDDVKNREVRTVFINGKMKDIDDNCQLLMNVRIEKPLQDMVYSGEFCDNKVEELTMNDTLDRLEDYMTKSGWSKYPEGDEYIVRANKLNIYYYKYEILKKI